MQQPGLFATNEHATALAVQSVWTRHVELIAEVHWLTIRNVANEPSEGWEPLSCCLDINDSFDHSAHIVSIANDLVKVEGLLPRVAPDRAGIGVTSILCQIIQTHATSAQQGQAGTAATLPGIPSPCFLHIHTGLSPERRH